MAKMTLAQLKSDAGTYVAANKQAQAWSGSTNNVVGLLDKIAKTFTIDGNFQDKLPELDGEDLPLGKTIEEWFVDLTLPEAFNESGSGYGMGDHTPSFEAVTYSYTLGRKVIPTTVKYDNVERACNSAEEFGSIIAKIMERLTNSETLWKYQQKKQLLANMITKAESASRSEVIAKPVDDVTGEAFIKAVKADVEGASFASENTSLGGYLIGAAPELVLFIKKGVIPSLEVDTLAGIFNQEKMAIPARVVIVDDFGNAADKYYAMLVDPRGIKLHNTYRAVRDQLNAEADRISYFLHSEYTGYISKSTFVKVYKAS